MTDTPTPIVLDCDPGLDDAIAIMVALGSAEVEVLAVTTVAGNAPLHHTTANAIRVPPRIPHQRRCQRSL